MLVVIKRRTRLADQRVLTRAVVVCNDQGFL